MSLFRRLMYGSFFNSLAIAFNQGSTFAVNLAIAHLVSQKSFGEYAMAYNTLLTICVVGQLAIGTAATKYLSECKVFAKDRAGRIIGLCYVISLLTAVFISFFLWFKASWIAEAMLNSSDLASLIRLGAFFVFFAALNGCQVGILTGLEGFKELAVAGIFSGCFSFLFVFTGAWLDDLSGAFLGLGLGSFVRFCIHSYFVFLKTSALEIKPIVSDLALEIGVFLKFALPAAIGGLFSMPMAWLAHSFLIKCHNGYFEMSLYASSFSLRSVFLFFPQIINNVALTILSGAQGAKDKELYRKAFFEGNRLTIVSLFITFLIGFCFAPFWLGLFGKNYLVGTKVFRMLVFSTIFEGLSISLFQHIQVKEKLWKSLLIINVPREVTFVVIAFILVDNYGAMGLSIAYVICWLLTFIILYFAVQPDMEENCRTKI